MQWTFAGKAWELSPFGEFLVTAGFILAFILVFIRLSKKVQTDATKLKDLDKTQPATREQPAKDSKPSGYLTAKEKATLRPPVPELDLIDCAKIAKLTIESFDTSELLEIAHLIPKNEIPTALEASHEKLKPSYVLNLKSHYKGLGFEAVSTEQLRPALDRCMKYGFEGILKLESLQQIVSKENSLPSDADKNRSSKPIRKGRKWHDISADGGLDK